MGSPPGAQQAGHAPGAVRDRRRELGTFLGSRRARLDAHAREHLFALARDPGDQARR